MKFGERLASGTEGDLRISSGEIEGLPSQLAVRHERLLWVHANLYINVYHG